MLEYSLPNKSQANWKLYMGLSLCSGWFRSYENDIRIRYKFNFS